MILTYISERNLKGLQRIASLLGDKDSHLQQTSKNSEALLNALKQKQITSYMLSNQLPMLQLGRKLPEVTGQNEKYCEPEGDHYD